MPVSTREFNRFKNLSYDKFREMAVDHSLSAYEKIGFPNSYRRGTEKFIFSDMLAKLATLNKKGQLVVDIGPGCSKLPQFLIQHCEKHKSRLYLIDSPEMLDLLPDSRRVQKVPGRFPDVYSRMANLEGQVDCIIVYSVLHYIFSEANLFAFLDKAVTLLKSGGELLLGDIPNISLRRRFFSSQTGIAFHKRFMKTSQRPKVSHLALEEGEIDDSIIFSILGRYRNFGYETYVLPQDSRLSMANRREDILIRKH